MRTLMGCAWGAAWLSTTMLAGCRPPEPAAAGEACDPMQREPCEDYALCFDFEVGDVCSPECLSDCDCPSDMLCDSYHEGSALFCFPLEEVARLHARGEWRNDHTSNLCGAGPDSCRWAFDGVCDEPASCERGTDTTDCSAPMCATDSYACASHSDCCGGTCTDGVCGVPQPTCRERGDTCTGDVDCCSGLCCGDWSGCC